jgi:hypothetical protein
MEGQEGGKRSAWMSHVKKTMKAHKGMKLMQVLKLAKKTYKKTRRGGGLSPLPLGQDGGRRRRRGGQEDEEVKEGEGALGMVESKGGRRRTRKNKKSRKH